MIQKYNAYRILQLFFDQPTKHFQLREVGRLLNLGMPSVINHMKRLEKQELVKKEKTGVYDSYISSGSGLFKVYKRNDILLRIHQSGLIEYLEGALMPDVIVLFGSCSRAEDIEASDIDLFLIANEKDIDLKKFEKVLKRKISLHFEQNVSKVPKELLNNIINGIVVFGYFKVF